MSTTANRNQVRMLRVIASRGAVATRMLRTRRRGRSSPSGARSSDKTGLLRCVRLHPDAGRSEQPHGPDEHPFGGIAASVGRPAPVGPVSLQSARQLRPADKGSRVYLRRRGVVLDARLWWPPKRRPFETRGGIVRRDREHRRRLLVLAWGSRAAPSRRLVRAALCVQLRSRSTTAGGAVLVPPGSGFESGDGLRWQGGEHGRRMAG